jgi:sugar phosphate isomerase/epimerase
MKQVAVAAMWGVLAEAGGKHPLENLSELLDQLKALGYGGIEITCAHVVKFGSERFEAMLAEKGMGAVIQVFTSGPPPTPGNLDFPSQFGVEHLKDDVENFHNVARHKAVWRAQVEEITHFRSVVLSVTSHTGRDYFTAEEADDMLSYALDVEAETKLMINHETHRARIMYSPWVMPRILAAHPTLHLVADYSHFSVVSELGSFGDYVAPLAEVIRACNTRVRHIHGRVGFEEGPQVPDPREPQWAPYMAGYMGWWRGIVQAAAAREQAVLTTTPEYGPPLYAWTNPYDGNKPIANVWAVNHWTGQQLCKLIAEEGHEAATLIDDAREDDAD